MSSYESGEYEINQPIPARLAAVCRRTVIVSLSAPNSSFIGCDFLLRKGIIGYMTDDTHDVGSILEMVRREVPEIEEVMRFYEELERVYMDSLRSIGRLPHRHLKQVNLAQMCFSVPHRSNQAFCSVHSPEQPADR